jgi:hypothetical protein
MCVFPTQEDMIQRSFVAVDFEKERRRISPVDAKVEAAQVPLSNQMKLDTLAGEAHGIVLPELVSFHPGIGARAFNVTTEDVSVVRGCGPQVIAIVVVPDPIRFQGALMKLGRLALEVRLLLSMHRNSPEPQHQCRHTEQKPSNHDTRPLLSHHPCASKVKGSIM